MPPDIDLQHVAIQLGKLSLHGGFCGGMVWALFWSVVSAVADCLHDRQARHLRIAAARTRHVQGPGLYPGLSARERRFRIAIRRAQHDLLAEA